MAIMDNWALLDCENIILFISCMCTGLIKTCGALIWVGRLIWQWVEGWIYMWWSGKKSKMLILILTHLASLITGFGKIVNMWWNFVWKVQDESSWCGVNEQPVHLVRKKWLVVVSDWSNQYCMRIVNPDGNLWTIRP